MKGGEWAMEFQEYVRGKETIRATETAFKAIYEAQGFALKKAAPPLKAGETDGKNGGDPADNSKGSSAGKSKKPK